jgi:hypothetical protein
LRNDADHGPLSRQQRGELIRDLGLVLLVAFGIRLFWAALTPPWMTPDEPQHFAYVAHIAENGAIPHPDRWDARYPNHSVEYEQSCTTTLCSRISGLGRGPGELRFYPLQHDYARARAVVGTPRERRTASGSSAVTYPPLYYLIVSLPYRLAYEAPILTRLLMMRALSAFMSAWGCVFGYLLAYEVHRSRAWGRALGLCLSLMPMYAFIGASLNNDALMFSATSALCWLLVRAWRNGLSVRLATALGAASGIALLSKPTGAPVVLFAGLSVLWLGCPSLTELRRFRLGELKRWSVFAAALLLSEGVWLFYRRATALPAAGGGDPNAIGPLQIVFGQGRFSWWDYVVDVTTGRGPVYYDWLFMRTFWGCFGWLEIFLSDTTYSAIYIITLLACGGLVWRVVKKPDERKMLLALTAMVAANVVLLFMSADYVLSFATKGRTYGMQGRYFYGTLAPLLLLMSNGVSWLFRDHSLIVRLIPLPMLVLQCLSILGMLNAYYAVTLW